MLTPFMSPQIQSECNRNRAHRKTRVTIECVFGVFVFCVYKPQTVQSGPILFSPNLHIDEENFEEDPSRDSFVSYESDYFCQWLELTLCATTFKI